MKKILIIGFILISEFVYSTSPQISDLLIIHKDTISINLFPLEDYLEKNESNYIDQIRKGDNGELIINSTNCFKGYQAIWKLENDKLYLIKIIGYGFKEFENSHKVLNKLFGDKFRNDKVLADWFSSDITLPKGEIIRQNLNLTKVYEKNEVLKFDKGVLSETILIDNRNQPKLKEIKID